MAGRNGQELLGTWVPADVAARFKAHARMMEGGVSAELRRLVVQAAEGKAVPQPLGAAGHRVMVRLRDGERHALLQAARDRATSPANWLRSLALAHLSKSPQWNDAELQALRDVFVELRRIGNNVNQIARALNTGLQKGELPSGQGQAAKDAVDIIASEVRRVGELAASNTSYWGIPDVGDSADSLSRRTGPRRPTRGQPI